MNINNIIDKYSRAETRVLYGPKGIGKTFTALVTIDRLEKQGCKIAYIEEQFNNIKELSDSIEKILFPDRKHPSDNILNAFDCLFEQLETKYGVVIDNCHLYDEKMLEKIYTIFHDYYPFYLILVGREELKDKIDKTNLKVRYNKLVPLTCEETEGYIWHHLVMGGYSKNKANPFKDCINEIQQLTGGIPFDMNILCSALLEIASEKGQKIISKEMVWEAKELLEL